MAMTVLNDLPVLVSQPGWYLTRIGELARIDEIRYPPKSANPDNTIPTTCFPVKGSIRKKLKKVGKWKWEYNIWHVSGRGFIHDESPKDLVEYVEEQIILEEEQ